MPTTQELLLRLDATTDGLRRELAKADQSVGDFARKVDNKMGKVESSISKLGSSLGGVKTLLAGFGVGLGINEIVGFGRAALDLADDLQDTAAQLGVSTTALQTFQFAGRQSGVEAEKVGLALQTLSRTIGEAASGSKSAQEKFKGLGIAFRDAAGNARSSEQVLSDLANLIQQLPTPAERAAAAAQLLGAKAGPQLVPLLANGAQGLRDWQKAAQDAGQVLSEETVKRLADAQQAIEDFSNRLTIVSGDILGAILSWSDAAKDGALPTRLAAINTEIAQWKKTLDAAESGNSFQQFIAGLTGSAEDARQKLKELRTEQAELLKQLNGGSTRRGGGPSSGKRSDIPAAPGSGPAITIDLGGTGSGGKTDAEKKAEKLADAMKRLQAAADALHQSSFETTLAKWLDDAGATADSAAGKKIAGLVEQLDKAALATEAVKAVQESDAEVGRKWADEMKRGKDITESLQTPFETYLQQLRDANQLLVDGAISQDTFNRAAVKAADDYNEAIGKTKASSIDLKGGLTDITQTVGTSFEDAALKAKNLRSVVQGLAQDIARIGLRMAVTKPLESFLGNLFQSIDLNSSVGAAMDANPALFAGGGIMTSRGRVPLRKYSGGGVANSPQLAMFGEGATSEAFVPVPNGKIPVELKSVGGGGVSIQQVFNVEGGSEKENQDLTERLGKEMRRQMLDLVDQRLATHQRDGGMFRRRAV